MTVRNLLSPSSKFILQYMLCDTGQISFKHLSFLVGRMLSIFGRGWSRGVQLQEEGVLMLFPAAACWVSEDTVQISSQSRAQCVHCFSNLAVMPWPSNNLPALCLMWKLPQGPSASASGPIPHLHHRQLLSFLSPFFLQTCTWAALATPAHSCLRLSPVPHLSSEGLLPACPSAADLSHWLA